jgi:D-sedoheptulose 7-phosphate isomerase
MEDLLVSKNSVREGAFLNGVAQFSQLLAIAIISAASNKIVPLEEGMQTMIGMLSTCREQEGTIYVAGNGGSAAIASHVVIDLLNKGSVRATAMLDPAVTTCLSNDFGYEHIYERQLLQFARKEDLLIAISSSGNSKNILNAVKAARLRGAKVITLSGFEERNPLREVGDVNLWLTSKDYGQVEIGHAFVLHHLTDCLAESATEGESV